MSLPSDVRFQRLVSMQFPRGSPALIVQNTFIHVDNDDSVNLRARRGHHSKTLPATLPPSMERVPFLEEVDQQKRASKLKHTESVASTAGSESELGLNETCETYETTSAASYDIHLALPSQDPVINRAPSLKFRQDEETLVRSAAGTDDDCSPLRRWSQGSSSHQKVSDESSSLTTDANDSSPSFANLRRKQTSNELAESRQQQTSAGQTNLFSVGNRSSAVAPQFPFGNQSAELLYRMVGKAPRPQPLFWTQCRDACCFNVSWTLDARKVRGNDRQVVSPPVELPLAPDGRQVKLRLMIYPKEADVQSVQNFRSSRSRGFIQIKCEPDVASPTVPVRFALAVGSGCRTQGAKGPVDNDFAKNNICGLPKNQDAWDFFSATDTSNMTVPIFLELTRIDLQ